MRHSVRYVHFSHKCPERKVKKPINTEKLNNFHYYKNTVSLTLYHENGEIDFSLKGTGALRQGGHAVTAVFSVPLCETKTATILPINYL